MHSVKCTNCGRSLTIPKPVIKGKIRCPACGQVFVGTTHPVGAVGPSSGGPAGRPAGPETGASSSPRVERPETPDAAEAPAPRPPAPVAKAPARPAAPAAASAGPPRPAGKPARPPTPPAAQPSLEEVVAAEEAARATGPAGHRPAPTGAGYRPGPMAPRRSNKAIYLYLLMGGLLLFLVTFVILMAHYAGTTHYEVRDQYGRVVNSGRAPKDEVDRMRHDAANVPDVIIRQDPNAPPARTPATRSTGRPERDPLPKMTPAPEGASQPAAPDVAALPEDPKIRALSAAEKHYLPASTDTGFVTGVVSNKYDRPLAELRLTPQILDSGGRVLVTLREFVCQYVPAGGAARYSADFAGVEDGNAPVRVSAKVVLMDKGETCYDAEEGSLAFEYLERSVVVTGRVANGGLKAIENCSIHCEFYTRDWKFVRSARGELLSQDATDGRLAVGRKSRFKAELQLDEPDPTNSIAHAVARVVGKEE